MTKNNQMECATECTFTDFCRAFTFNKSTKKCVLSMAKYADNPNAEAAITDTTWYDMEE